MAGYATVRGAMPRPFGNGGGNWTGASTLVARPGLSALGGPARRRVTKGDETVLEHDHLEALDPSEFSYRGVEIGFDRPTARDAATASIKLGDRTYSAGRHHDLWTVPGVFNMYSSLGQLARHMVDLDLQGILPPPEKPRRTRTRRKG